MSNNFKREANKQKRLRLYRILSVIICAFCLIYSSYAKDAEKTVRLFFSLIFPLALIWFGDQIGSLTGGYQVWWNGTSSKQKLTRLIYLFLWRDFFMCDAIENDCLNQLLLLKLKQKSKPQI